MTAIDGVKRREWSVSKTPIFILLITASKTPIFILLITASKERLTATVSNSQTCKLGFIFLATVWFRQRKEEENNSIILCLIISEVTTNNYKFQTITISSFVYLPMIIENMFHSSSCSPTNVKGLHIRWAKIGVSKQFDRKPVLISFCRMAAKKFATWVEHNLV